jgi:hypothetical protein
MTLTKGTYYKNGLQTEQALPLYLGVIPAEAKARLLDHTTKDIAVTNLALREDLIAHIRAQTEMKTYLHVGTT